jgi:ribonuclease Z
MNDRELLVLGTSSAVPTRHRNHNGYLLRWNGMGLLFDPGEGTQRQFLYAGTGLPAVTTILITHFHGDHCLGLPGVIQRLGLDEMPGPIEVFFPLSGRKHFDALLGSSAYHPTTEVIPRPLDTTAITTRVLANGLTIESHPLEHRVDTLGYRVSEPPRRTFIREKLDALGLAGPAVGELERNGQIDHNGETVRLVDVSIEHPGAVFSLVMDTRRCEAAVGCARGADLLVCESTYLHADAEMAYAHGHLTSVEAAEIAARAGARRLVLTHFSQRYTDTTPFVDEARAVFADVVAADDLDRFALPRL